MVVRSTANNTKPPRVVKIPTKPVMAEALGSTEAADAQTKQTQTWTMKALILDTSDLQMQTQIIYKLT